MLFAGTLFIHRLKAFRTHGYSMRVQEELAQVLLLKLLSLPGFVETTRTW
jgi:hypothetical protein